MLEWMPTQVIEKFGRTEDSVLNGPLLSIDPKAEPEIVAALEHDGWSCVKNEPLVLEARGYQAG